MQINAEKNNFYVYVNEHVYSPDMTMSSVDCTILHSWHSNTFLHYHLSGKNSMHVLQLEPITTICFILFHQVVIDPGLTAAACNEKYTCTSTQNKQ